MALPLPLPHNPTRTPAATPAATANDDRLSPASTTPGDVSTHSSSLSSSHSPSSNSSRSSSSSQLRETRHPQQQPISINFPLPSSHHRRYDDRDPQLDRDTTPRRPRRSQSTNQFRTHARSGSASGSARDEIEHHFLNRISLDGEAPVISDVLDGVDFRQVSDDEEDLDESDDGAQQKSQPQPQKKDNGQHGHLDDKGQRQLPDIADDYNDDDDDYDPDFSTIDLRRASGTSSSMLSSNSHFHDPHLFPSPSLNAGMVTKAHNNKTNTGTHTHGSKLNIDVGHPDCDDCTRLYAENRRLRRQIDELEFELASSTALRSPTHDNDDDDMIDDIYFSHTDSSSKRPSIPIPHPHHFPSSSVVTQHHVKKKKSSAGGGGGGSWTSKLSKTLNPSAAKSSERAILRSQVQALTVTTEYLWRKLNKAEVELRNYRLRELRTRMKLAQNGGGASANGRLNSHL